MHPRRCSEDLREQANDSCRCNGCGSRPRGSRCARAGVSRIEQHPDDDLDLKRRRSAHTAADRLVGLYGHRAHRAVRPAHGPARLQPPAVRRSSSRSRGCRTPCCREVPGRHAGQPRRPGRLRPHPVAPRRSTCPTTPVTPTTGSASTRAASASSMPALSCDPNYFGSTGPATCPTTQALETYWLTMTGLRRRPAAQARPALLQHLKTIDSAKDMESIRHALGAAADQLLRLLLRHLPRPGLRHPLPVARCAAWSSTATSTRATVWYAANLDQDVAFDRNINIWFGWLAKYDDVYHLGDDRKGRRTTSGTPSSHAARGASRPAASSARRVDRHASSSAGYYQQHLDRTGQRLRRLDPRPRRWHAVMAAYDDGQRARRRQRLRRCTSPSSAPTCRGRRAGRPGSTDNSARSTPKAPFETWSNAWFNAPCPTGRPRPARR